MVPFFFTFLDGAFRYDCASCGQACCRGKGIAIDAQRELVPLLRRAPGLAAFVEPLAGGYVRLPDVTDGCWFLRPDGLCSYEQDHGRAAKFTTCRLFPYNRVFRAGAVRVVDVNSVVCPIQDALATGAGVTHAELRAELEAIGDGPLTSNAADLPEGARELRWHALEQAILTESERFLATADYVDFAAWQESKTRLHLGAARTSDKAAELHALLLQWSALYPAAIAATATAGDNAAGNGAASGDGSAAARAASRAVTLLTGSLRFNALFRRGAGSYRSGVAPLGRQLLATWFLTWRAALATGRPPSLRAVTELHQAQAAQRALLARFGEPAELRELPPAPDAPPAVQEALRRLSKQPAGKDPGSLGAQLAQAATELPVEQRAWLIPLLLRAGPALRFRESH